MPLSSRRQNGSFASAQQRRQVRAARCVKNHNKLNRSPHFGSVHVEQVHRGECCCPAQCAIWSPPNNCSWCMISELWDTCTHARTHIHTNPITTGCCRNHNWIDTALRWVWAVWDSRDNDRRHQVGATSSTPTRRAAHTAIPPLLLRGRR
jgi:hypothetical protein